MITLTPGVSVVVRGTDGEREVRLGFLPQISTRRTKGDLCVFLFISSFYLISLISSFVHSSRSASHAVNTSKGNQQFGI